MINATHTYPEDSCQSISIFTESRIGPLREWYFIFPNSTRDGEKAILIALRHGVSIMWDGKKLFHCSTALNETSCDNVYGTYFGIT